MTLRWMTLHKTLMAFFLVGLTLVFPAESAAGVMDGLKAIGRGIEHAVGKVVDVARAGFSDAGSSPTPRIRGTLRIHAPLTGYLTCFEGIDAGYASTRPIAAPHEAESSPTLILTENDVVTWAQCEDLDKKGLLTSPAGPAMPTATASGSSAPAPAASTLPPATTTPATPVPKEAEERPAASEAAPASPPAP